MDFDYSDKVEALRGRLTSFMNEAVLPNEETFHRQIEDGGDRWQTPRAGCRPVEPVSAGQR